MSRFSPPSPAPASPDTGKPRVVIDYSGMQIVDARDRIKVILVGEPPRGVKGCLRHEGFRLDPDGSWSRAHNPMSIAAAQAIGSTFFQPKT